MWQAVLKYEFRPSCFRELWGVYSLKSGFIKGAGFGVTKWSLCLNLCTECLYPLWIVTVAFTVHCVAHTILFAVALQFQWRNGWFSGISQREIKAGLPDPFPTHTQLLKELKLDVA